jgi:hypothetical protein
MHTKFTWSTCSKHSNNLQTVYVWRIQTTGPILKDKITRRTRMATEIWKYIKLVLIWWHPQEHYQFHVHNKWICLHHEHKLQKTKNSATFTSTQNNCSSQTLWQRLWITNMFCQFTPSRGTYLLTYLLHGAESFLRSYLVLQLVNKFPAFMEPESSLRYSQVPATCPLGTNIATM